MSTVIAFVLSNWRWVGGAMTALLIAGLVWGHFHHDAKVRGQLVAAHAAARQARADNALWAQAYRDEKRAVDLQNDAIGKMAVRAADWQRAAQAATAEAHRANLKAQASAAEFMRFKPKGATVCERVSSTAQKIREDAR